MKKYIVGIVLIFFVLLISINSFAASKPCLYLKDVTKYANKDEVTVEIYMENVDSKIVTLGFDVFYDNSKIEYVSSKAGKDLNASFKLAENVQEENRVAIGALSFDGFTNNGLYYSIKFKVKDDSENIPIKLNIREATDSNGNDIEITSRDGTIKLSSEQSKAEEKTVNNNQQINYFEKTESEEIDNIENLITENGNVDISEDDDLVYETENNSVVEILDDGTMIPNQDGKTNIRVKLNDQTIGNIEVEVKNGKINKISGNEKELNFVPESTTQENIESNASAETIVDIKNNELTNNSKTINTKDEENSKKYLNQHDKSLEKQSSGKNAFKYIAILIVVITFLFIIFLIIKKKRGGKK